MNRRGHKLMTQLGALFLVLLLVPVLALVGFAEETEIGAEPVCYEHGDVTGDTVVDSRDAVYALYHSVWAETDPTKYPVSQNCDFNNDGVVDGKDAVWLLYASLGIVEGYELEGTIHEYYTPEWTWAEDNASATLTVRCGCGNGSEEVEAEITHDHQDASCTEAGWDTYTAIAEFGGVKYESAQKQTIAATGHALGDRTCTEGTACSNEGCTYTLPALGHSYQADSAQSAPATCTTDAVNVYVCQTCSDTKTVTEYGTATGHTYGEGEVNVNGCASYTVYQCNNCDHTITTNPVVSHIYTVALTKEANCTEIGTRTYTCQKCNDSYTEDVAVNGIHVWDGGVTADGVTTYSCTYETCGATKTAVVASTSAEVSKEILQEAEVQLDNASVSLDDATLEGIEGEEAITIEVVEKDVAELTLNTTELPGEIVNNTVYEFTMKQGETEITEFDGSVTISIPYELQPGDDVDCIDVWFIDDNGNVDCYKGTYSNGQVTFTTTHFSYYTVTRLTAAERCAQYGHVEKNGHLDATCDADGYDMVSCQRCGNVEKSVIPAMGHSYTETKVDATCTADGSVTKTCGTCGHESTTVLPALGHAWGEPAVESATCTTAGSETYTCGTCGDFYTTTLAQLAHSYDVTKEVVADCTTDGYATYTCTSCGDSYTESTGSATGHDYQAAEENWDWAEDYSRATVTLVCSHNAEHTKTLNATVTKTSEDCFGHQVYTAAASLNTVSYTSVKEVDTGVESHTPSQEWVSMVDSHYHYCVRCDLVMDEADHNLIDQTVVMEPTCVNSGSAVATCTVCEYQLTTILSATGTHSYVDGTCVVCGAEDISCKHLKMQLKELDMSGFNICEGGKIQMYTCDCGEKSYLNFENISCNFGYSETRMVTRPDGYVYYIYTTECTECGLVYEYASYDELDTETCDTYMVNWCRLSKNGIAIAECKTGELMGSHFMNAWSEKVELSNYGMCGDVLSREFCYCRAHVYTFTWEQRCAWELTSETENGFVYTCSACGVVKTIVNERNFDKSNCMDSHVCTVTYALGEESVYSYVDTEGYEMHEYRLTSYEMDGENCEDGILVVMTCETCGKVHEYFTYGHPYIVEKKIDLSGYDFCVDVFYHYVCPCGAQKDCGVDGEKYCSFSCISEDEENQTYVYQCAECGLTRTERTVKGQKDVECRFEVVIYITYADASGKTVAEGTREYDQTEHNWKRTATLLEGSETCEDGVRIDATCTDCGSSFFYTTEGHESVQTEVFDLGALGLCGGKLVHEACACGENDWVNREEPQCSWEHYDYYTDYTTGNEVDHSIEKCSVCGAFEERQFTYTEAGQCKRQQDVKVTVTLNEVVVVETEYHSVFDDHRYVYDLAALDGSCENGVSVTRRCVECGAQEHWGDYYDSHSVWMVNREMLSEDQICADVEMVYYSCACGQEQRTETWWSGTGCEWDDGYHDDETGCWVMQCTVCGAYYYQRHESEQVEGTCEVKQTGYYTYRDKDGNELFSYTDENSYYDHSYVHSFDMQGATCEEGYYVSWTCVKCGESSTEPEYRTDCTNWLTAYEVLCDSEDICDQIVKITHENPCGSYKDTYVSSECSFNWFGYDEEAQADIYRCNTCGLIRKWSAEGHYESEDSCVWVETNSLTYSMDGAELASTQYENITQNHSTVATFVLEGESCDDGYYLTEVCSRCGETVSDAELRYAHEYFRTEYYDLTDYGLCGGEIWRTNCACGDYSNWHWNFDGCDWVYEGADSATGVNKYRCTACNTVRYFASSGVTDTETCTFKGTFVLQLFRDDVQLLSINGALRWESHHYLVESFTMEGETCEDGYTAHYNCRYCDDGYDEWNSGHADYTVEYIGLRTEYGLCGGAIWRTGCACGARSDWNWDFEACDWTVVSDEADGLEHYYCENCNTYRDFAHISVIDRQTCTSQTTMIVKLTRDDVTLLDLNEVNTAEVHSYETTFEGTCTDESFKVIHTCIYCGKTQEGWASGHDAYVVKRVIDLSTVEGPCDTSVEHVSCPCGENSWVNRNYYCNSMSVESWDEAGADGYTHYFQKHQCGDCGFKAIEEWYYVTDTVNCLETRYETYSFYNGETQIYTCDTWDTYDAHSYGDPTVALMDGAETCEDGIIVTHTCTVCGYVDTDTHYYHATYAAERIDLQQYGAICDTELVIYACACGENKGAQLEGAEMCDMEWVWVDEKPYEQYNTNGHVFFYDQYHILTCAVSEPQCGFKIYHTRSWEPLEDDPCVYEKCEFWWLGWDKETGEYQTEIVVRTGEKQLYHNYTIEAVTENQEDGSTITTETFTCSDCGSTYVYTLHMAAEGHTLSYTNHAVSTLTNEFDKEWYQENELGVLQSYYNLAKRQYTRQVHADGTEYWSESVYSYNFENACQRTVTHTDSYGTNDTWSDDHFYGWSGSTDWTKEPTCTQFGEGVTTWTCELCGEEREETAVSDPYCHSWYPRGDGTYGCERCNMISEVDASGSIVLEDLSNYKSGDEYIAGYWNRGNVEFTTYVCVYLVDAAEGENDEILLDGIETTMLTLEDDGMTAISFSWSGADAAADAAVAALEESYDGEYYVRLVFVPVNSEDTLDYAVTFVPEEY